MTSQNITPSEAAALLVAILERRGAIFTLRPDDTFHCDLDGTDLMEGSAETDRIAQCVLALRDEIRVWLQSQQIRH